MQRRELLLYLSDILTSAEAIQGFVGGRQLDDYRCDLMLRSAVERQFEIIGEALAQLRKYHPNFVVNLTSEQSIIDFRNRVIHAYFAVNDEIVWSIAQDHLSLLIREVRAMADTIRE